MVRVQTSLTDAPPLSTYLPTGQALAVLRFGPLPSWNDVLDAANTHPARGGALIKEYRTLGYHTAIAWATDSKLPCSYQAYTRGRTAERLYRLSSPITLSPVFTFARYFREPGVKQKLKGNRRRDAFNLWLKALTDGFTDAGLWEDDREELVPNVWVHYAGVASPGYTEIWLYESPC